MFEMGGHSSLEKCFRATHTPGLLSNRCGGGRTVYFRYPQTDEMWVNTVSNPIPVLVIVDQNVTMYTARPPKASSHV